MRYYSNYLGFAYMSVWVHTLHAAYSLHKHHECLNGVWCTVISFATICVRYCTCLCGVSCDGQPCSFSHSLSTLSLPLLHHLQSAVPLSADTAAGQKVCCFSLSISICLSLSSNQSLSSPPPPSSPPSPFHLVRLLSPLCFRPRSLAPSFCPCFHLLDRSSASGVPTVIWQLYEFYTLSEYNYVQLISWMAARHHSTGT